MTFFGEDTEYYERILFVAFGLIAGILCILQMIFYQELKIVPVYLLPFLSFCICFENFALYRQENIEEDGSVATAGKVFHSFIVPLFVMLLFEVPFRLHETRLAHFGCIPFEQGTDMPSFAAQLVLITERVIALGLFAMNIIVNFNFVREEDKHSFSGIGGYKTLAEHRRSLHLWLSLIPSMALSVLGIYICFVLYKYAKHCTLGISNNRYWRAIIPCSIFHVIGQFFGTSVYQITSNAGEVALLIGVTFIVGLVQRDLVIAGSFANFLYKSNKAFEVASSIDLTHMPDTPPRVVAKRVIEGGETVNEKASLQIALPEKDDEERVANLA